GSYATAEAGRLAAGQWRGSAVSGGGQLTGLPRNPLRGQRFQDKLLAGRARAALSKNVMGTHDGEMRRTPIQPRKAGQWTH
ncbi:hypothetical protein, partial [Mycobacterium tuberculosis]|uniref:hypothetical protein n=1 Tax=Mycobacterium tuberculosis TaxID=1773 RepID=UPI001BDE5B2E